MKSRVALVLCSIILAFSGIVSAESGEILNKSNWLQEGYNVRSFQEPGTVQFTRMVSRQDTPASELQVTPHNFDTLTYEGVIDGRVIRITFAEHLELTQTDALLVLHNGDIIYEGYFNDMAPYQRHIMMSVTKSFTGTLVAMLIDEGKIDENATVSEYIPELADSVYGPITIRNLLDMRTGVNYSEDYADPNSDVWSYISSIGLLPHPVDYDGPRTIRDYLPTMEKASEPGCDFEYVTPVTEVLVWLSSKVSGKSFIELLSDRILPTTMTLSSFMPSPST